MNKKLSLWYSIFPKIIDYIQKKYVLIGVFVFALFLPIAYFLNFSQTVGIFEVSGTNFEVGIKKLPYNASEIEITFSQDLLSESITQQSLKITPEVPGKVVLKSPNMLAYVFDEKLKIGQDYTISLDQNIQSIEEQFLGKDILYIVSAVPGAQVLNVFPKETLQDISKSMAVFFSVPEVPFMDLESKNNLPCPIVITPKINGKCSWTTTSVVEFIPETTFSGATDYSYAVQYMSGMNYPLETTFTGKFQTPELTVQIGSEFHPKNNIDVTFNFPVDSKQAVKYIKLFSELEGNQKSINFSLQEVTSTHFKIIPTQEKFQYQKNYHVEISQGLPPKYGNMPLKNTQLFDMQPVNFLSSTELYQNIFSSTGELIDTKHFLSSFVSGNLHIPLKNTFFNISFEEEVLLDKNNFSFKSASGTLIDFDIKYLQEEDSEKKIKENKQAIQLFLKTPLVQNTTYTFEIKKQISPYLTYDIVYSFQTAPDLQVMEYKFIDYSKSCIYLNNPVDNEVLKKSLAFSQSGTIKEVYEDNLFEDDFHLLDRFYKITEQKEKNDFLAKNGYCPEALSGQKLYIINTRLNPKTSYTFQIKNTQDIYGNILKKDFVQNVVTGELQEKDKYVYAHFPNYLNVFPKNVPMGMDIQTINMNEVYVDVCEMNFENYKKYLQSPDSTFDCTKKHSKKISVQNKNWLLSHTFIDIEKDILGYQTPYHFLGIEILTQSPTLTPNKGKKIQHLIQRPNMSLFMEKAENIGLMYATDFQNHEEITDLNLDFYDFNYNKVAIKYSFNKQKKVYQIDNNMGGISFVVASNSTYYGIVGLSDELSNYDFKYVGGQDSYTRHYAYIYSDRPIYRPGDEVFFKGIVREFQYDGFHKSKSLSGTLRLIDDNWETYRTLDITLDKNSNFTGSFVIPKDSKLGNFQFELSLNGVNDYIYGNGFLSIEEYKKPIFKIDIQTDIPEPQLGSIGHYQIKPEYYFGGNIINTTGQKSILAQNYFFDAKEYSDYSFGQNTYYYDCLYWGYCNYGDQIVSYVQDFSIDDTGIYSMTHDFGTSTGESEKIYTFNFDVTDPDTQKTVSNSVSQVLHTTDGYVGIKAPYYSSVKKGIDFDVITLDYDANILANKPVGVTIYKKDFVQVKKMGVDGVFYNEYSEQKTKEKTFSLLTNSLGQATSNFKAKQSGQYVIEVSYTGKNGFTFTSEQLIYIAGDDYVSWGNDNNTVTNLEPEKMTYKVGETARFVLQSPVNNGKAFIIVEKDDGILDYFVHNIQSYGDTIDIPLKDTYYPNVYVKAYLIGSMKDNPLPVYKRALSGVKVLTDYKNLNVSIKTDKKAYNPGESVAVTIQVTDKNGKAVPNANLSLSIVDESVLALKGNPRKNPYAFFYEMKRYLGVLSFSNLKYLVEKLEIKDTSNGEKGGAGDMVKGGDTKKLRGNFKDTAFWSGNITTQQNGQAVITIPQLPDNLTTWVIEALANTSDTNQIGVNYETIMTSTPVMIEDNLPRFLIAGDTITFAPVIYNRTGTGGKFKIDIAASNGKIQSISKTIELENNASQKVEFQFQVGKLLSGKNIDISQIVISVQSLENVDFSDKIIKKIPIYDGSIIEYVATIGKTKDASFDEKIQLSSHVSQPELQITYGATLFTYLLDGIDYLHNYPYGCAEQRTSTLMPNIYTKQLYDVAGIPFDLKTKMISRYVDADRGNVLVSVDEVIRDYLSTIGKFQNIDGGFVYWDDVSPKISDIQLTNYILKSLSEIQKLGYEVDKNIIINAQQYLLSILNKYPDCDEQNTVNCMSSIMRKHILNTLVSIDKNNYQFYKIYNQIKIDKIPTLDALELTLNISKISSLSVNEKKFLQQRIDTYMKNLLNNELVFNSRGAFLSSSHESRIVNTAKFIELLGKYQGTEMVNIDTIIDNMIRFIISYKDSVNIYGSTYDNSLVIASIISYLSTTKELQNTQLSVELGFNGKIIEHKNIKKGNIFDTNLLTISGSELKNNNIVNINKTGTGTIYYDFSLGYRRETKNISAVDEGIYIQRTYYNYNDYKKIERIKKLEYQEYIEGKKNFEDLIYPGEVIKYLSPLKEGKVGELILVYNKVVTNESRDQIAVEAFIPSGTELVNTQLQTENKTITNAVDDSLIFDRTELRDDRYFGWKQNISPGIYNFSYTLRATHAGTYNIKPTQISEFYTPETFGQTKGEVFNIQ